MTSGDRSPRLLIAGASVRAAAASAARAGLRVLAADRYADADLAALATVLPLARYPADLSTAMAATDCDAWMYTGGFENHPRLVNRLASRHPLWGNGGDVLRAVRNPVRLRAALVEAGFDAPEMAADGRELPRDGTWLRKARRGSGGVHVAPWNENSAAAPADLRHYFQRRVAGRPCGATFVAAVGNARLLGITEQLLAPRRAGAAPFRYGGSLGPAPISAAVWATLTRLGQTLARRFRLVGLFGVDGLWDDDRFWPVEVNPRYTASVEVLERATGLRAIGLHLAACRDGDLPGEQAPPTASSWFGKRIVYAPRRLLISAEVSDRLLGLASGPDEPQVADIPRPGTVIGPEAPVATVFAAAGTRDEVLCALEDRSRQVLELCSRGL